MQEGAYTARGALIISPKHDEIANLIMNDMERGVKTVTVLQGRGSYTKEEKDVLYCVVGKNEVVRLKGLINAVDPHAFVSVTIVHDVLGEGLLFDENKKPIEV